MLPAARGSFGTCLPSQPSIDAGIMHDLFDFQANRRFLPLSIYYAVSICQDVQLISIHAAMYIEVMRRKKKNPAAVTLGSMGGKARAKKLSPERRREIARNAIRARWGRRKSAWKWRPSADSSQ